jgi:hypothetical protein
MREIENPATGERIVFRRTTDETGGELLEMDDFWALPDHRTPEHSHPEMEESWEVVSGRPTLRIRMRPALRWQEFVERLFALTGGGGADLAALTAEFSREIAR